MMVSVFIGTSVDGFIARSNGDLDFLPKGGGEPHGYDEFIASVDALVIGRKTFETVLAFPAWPYGKKRVVVLSSQPVDLSIVREGRGGTHGRSSGRDRREARRQRRPSSLRRRRQHDSKIPARRPGSASHDHPSACAHRRRHPSFRRPATRSAASSPGHAAIFERPGKERVPGCPLINDSLFSDQSAAAGAFKPFREK